MPNTDQKTPKPVVLCILDGWGERDGGDDNAIFHGHTPCWDKMRNAYPTTTLGASSEDVGLPAGQMGNSEVGHMNIGAGRVVMQDLPLIDAAVADGTIADNAALTEMIEALQANGRVCHLMGLVSPGGVHSHQDHLVALAKIICDAGVPVRLHAFLDGRDTAPSSGRDYVAEVIKQTSALDDFKIVTVTGRYYAMDRDTNWDRVIKAYKAITGGVGAMAIDALSAIDNSYDNGVTDEFMLPAVMGGYHGVADGDAVFMFNFRADRAREIMASLVDPDFDGFERNHMFKFSARLGLREYSSLLGHYMEALFPNRKLDNVLGQVVSDQGLTQLRIAETEKYAHVTFFFNGGREQEFDGEERILVPSPKVATYDLQPEMSAVEVTDNLVEAIECTRFDLIIVNYANGDMVGHTGVFEAAVKAAETIDSCLARLENALIEVGGVMLVTADHGNAERMLDTENGGPHTAHTLSPVPVILVNPPAPGIVLKNGALSDVAPTLLELLQIDQPGDMTGTSLIVR